MLEPNEAVPTLGPRSYTLAEWSAIRRIGRTRTFEEISSGRLKTYKAGRRRFVTEAADAQWLRDREAETQAA